MFPRRSYLPELERFTSVDPVQERGGINLYRFVKNNPLRYVDPLGYADVVATPTAGTEAGSAGTEAGEAAEIGEAGEVAAPEVPVLAEPASAAAFTAVGLAGIGGMVYSPMLMNPQNDPYLNPLGVNAPPSTVAGVLPLPKLPTVAPPVKPIPCPPSQKKPPVTFYHYSRNPNLTGLGLFSDSSATTIPGLSSQDASAGLGIPPPLYEYPVTIDPNVTPVQPQPPVSPNKYGPGGLPEVTFPNGTPPGSIGSPQVVK